MPVPLQPASPDGGRAAAPLAGVRVLDLTDGLGELGPRYLADLGADVIRVEPPGGGPSRTLEPCVDGVSLRYLAHNAGKRAVEIDLASAVGREQFLALATGADIVFEPGPAGALAATGITVTELHDRNPSLVVVSVSDFGTTGPYRDWVATEQVHLAMAGVLSRSGLPGLPPLIPPGSLASESTGIQTAWTALVAYLQRLRTGVGDHADVSAYEATAQVIDPGYGIGGSATGGEPAAGGARGRPDARHLYPIIRCRDGWVRICVLSARQWAGMFRWLGEPTQLADPALASIGRRHAAAAILHAAYEKHFARLSRDEAVTQGQQHGVPTAAVLTLAEAAESQHFLARHAFVELPVSQLGDRRVLVPNGLVEIDGHRAGIRGPAPAAGAHTGEVLTEVAGDPARATAVPTPTAASPGTARPLDGVRVLDLGVIVVGAELGRLLGDMGAEVIKVENSAFPDGSRQSLTGEAMSAGFALGHRNKASFGVNLRDPRGRELFLRLAASADVVLSNFKPGTLESLGLSYTDLSAVNPAIIVADSSAFGPTGPWSRRMGYGPLVRASTGLSDLWRYPGIDDGYSDASTIYPDHICARVSAVAIVAKLIERSRTGHGGTVSAAQAETILAELSTEIALESVRPGSVTAIGNAVAGDTPRGVFRCAGDDEWVVITIRDDSDFAALVKTIGRPDLASDPRYAAPADRVAHRGELDELVTAWTIRRSPQQVAGELQAARVPAAPMQRVTEYPADPHLRQRRFLVPMRHPLIPQPMRAERSCAVFQRMPDSRLEPAPLAGQQTRDIARRLLGLSDEEIGALTEDGVLEEATASDLEAAHPAEPSRAAAAR